MMNKEKISITKTNNKGAIRKSTHQYCEKRIPPSAAANQKLILKHPLPANSQIDRVKADYDKNSNLKPKYHLPMVNSSAITKKFQEQLNIDNFNSNTLSPKSRTSLAQEVTKQLNIPPDVKIFKNLTPINVNDSILMPEYADKNFRRTKYKVSVHKDKDPIPNLKDFLKPIEPIKLELEHYKRPNVLRKPNNDSFLKIRELITSNHPAW